MKLRRILIITALTLAAAAVAFALWLGINEAGLLLCVPGDACVREWLSALSGWAAVVAAVPTIMFLSKQIRDADRHQRTSFAIQLRRHRILATQVAQLAYVAIQQIELQDRAVEEGVSPDVRDWGEDLVAHFLEHLNGSVLLAFEEEIAFPSAMSGYGTAKILERGFEGHEYASYAASGIVKSYFEDVARQAEEFLAEVGKVTAGD